MSSQLENQEILETGEDVVDNINGEIEKDDEILVDNVVDEVVEVEVVEEDVEIPVISGDVEKNDDVPTYDETPEPDIVSSIVKQPRFDAKHPWFKTLCILFGGVCLLALSYVLVWVANVALGGNGVANATFVTKTWGRVLVSLVYSVPLAAAIATIVFTVQHMKEKDNMSHAYLVGAIPRFAILPMVMQWFAVFTLIDSGVLFFFSILADSIKGIGAQVIKNSYDVIAQILWFNGYEGLGVEKITLAMETDGVGYLLSILLGLFMFAYSIFYVVMWTNIKGYTTTLVNTAKGSQYDKSNKPPFILPLVFAGLNVALAIVAVIAGVWADAIVKLATAVILVGAALSFKEMHKTLHLTSID